jgi:pimeloyl-ACP methyl ester carboxylesterase
MRKVLLVLLTAALTMMSANLAYAQSSGRGPGETIPGTPFEKREVEDRIGRKVVYYVSEPASPAPLLLMIQGSGCVPVMNVQGTQTYSTLFNLLPFGNEGRFTVMAVEKPYSGFEVGAAVSNPGVAQECAAEFNDDFTAESWLVALQASIEDARRLSRVEPGRTLVIGFSEGAGMAAMLAADDDRITDVVSIGGSGTTQIFDLIEQAYRRCTDLSPCLADTDELIKAIEADPSNSSAFAWGHSYKRWASFFRVDPTDLLLRSSARIYIAFGTADESVPPLSHEVGVARLTAAGRDVTVRRVPNAGHMLIPSGSGDLGALDGELRSALRWFWEAPEAQQ